MALNTNQKLAIGGFSAPMIYDQFFGEKDNPEDAASKYLDQIPGTAKPYYDPFIKQGAQAGGVLKDQYGNLINDPGGKLSKIGAGYTQSPGYQWNLNQALNAGTNAAAAGGMAGSPMHQQQAMETASGYASKDFNDYMKNALGLYGQGLEGEQGFQKQGFGASTSLADLLANALQNKGTLAYEGQAAKNKGESDTTSGLMQMLPMALAALA